jgi:hypothetical protein
MEPAASSLRFNYVNGPTGKRPVALRAKANVVEGVPEMEFVQHAQSVEFILRGENQKIWVVHIGRMTTSRKRAIGWNPVEGIGENLTLPAK